MKKIPILDHGYLALVESKKILAAGKRGKATFDGDLEDAITAINRARQMAKDENALVS